MFWLLAVISLVLAVATWRAIPETLPAERRHTGGLRQTGRAFVGLARDRVFAGYALTVAFAYASLFGYISGSSFALQDLYGLSATQFSLVFAAQRRRDDRARAAQRAAGPPFPVRDCWWSGWASTVAAVMLLVVVAAGLSVLAGAAAAVRGGGHPRPGLGQRDRARVKRAPAAGSASAVLRRCMFGGGILVTPLLALGGEGTAVPMAAVVAGGAMAALLATVLLTRGGHQEPAVGADAEVSDRAIGE